MKSQAILEPCELEMFTYQMDPYIGCEHRCTYCYALNAPTALDEILLHDNLAEQLPGELSRIPPQTIYIGMNSDPYQPCEEPHRQTRQVLELLAEQGFSACLLTKSDLCTRDVDILEEVPGSSVGFSFAFQDDDTRKLFEPDAPSNKRRLAALEELKSAGIVTYVLVSPVMPYITEPESILRVVTRHADTIWFYPLRVSDKKDRNWRGLREILDRHFPDLTERFKEAAFSPDHVYWKEVRQSLSTIQTETGLDLRVAF